MRLLYVEDEPALLQVTAKRLKAEGYGVDTCANGTEALDYIALTDYDAVILDIMLPGRDGLSILREMRAQGNHTPVLLLTARDTVADRVAGLDTGADDYLVKPFSFEELSARIRVLLRRTAQEPVSNLLQLADLTDDLESLFVGFGTGVGEIHAAHAGHLGDQLFRELDGGDVADAVGEVAHFHHLLGDGVDDFLAAVADVDGPHAAGHGVKIGLAVDVGDAHAFALHIDGGLEILVLGQVVPNVLFVQSDQFSFIVSHGAFLMK